MVIISASGMLTGGRILHHLSAYGSDPKNAIILSGYQAGGTRGAALAAGVRDLRIYGEDVPIRADVIQTGQPVSARRRGRHSRVDEGGRHCAPHDLHHPR